MGKNNRKWTKWGTGNGSEGGWSSGGSSSGGNQREAEPKQWQKNWKCEACAYTSNCHWWWTCGRESCGAPWAAKDAAPATSTEKANTASELATKRDELKSLVIVLPEGHPTIAEFALKVKALEDAQKTGVSMAERLRRLLQSQKQLEAKQTAALAAMDKAKVELAKATATLKGRMEECETMVDAIAANTLEIAEVTRSAAPAVDPTGGPVVGTNMCQDLRKQIETLLPSDLSEAGTDMAGMGQFFVMFGKIMALLERAKTREAAPPPEVPAAAPAPAAPVAVATTHTAFLGSSQIPSGQPNPFTQVLPVDDEDESDEDATDSPMTGDGAAARELAKAEKLLESIKATEVGSCG